MTPLNTRLLSRRTMLRATGVAIALPLLDAMLPSGLRAEEKAKKLLPRRMVLISRPLGAHASFLFPEKAGMDYESTRYLKLLDDHRGRFTLFSGLSHPGHGFPTSGSAERIPSTAKGCACQVWAARKRCFVNSSSMARPTRSPVKCNG